MSQYLFDRGGYGLLSAVAVIDVTISLCSWWLWFIVSSCSHRCHNISLLMVAMVYCQQLQSKMSQYLFAHGGYGLLSAVAVIDVTISLCSWWLWFIVSSCSHRCHNISLIMVAMVYCQQLQS